MMNRKEVTDLINMAIDRLVKNDLILFDLGVTERAISYKLAYYMSICGIIHQPLTIDCEYNRDFGDPKRLNLRRRIQF